MAKSNPFTIADLEAKGFKVDSTGAYAKNNVGKPFAVSVGIAAIPDNFPLIDNYELHAKETGIKIKKTTRPKGKIKVSKSKPQGLKAIERVLQTYGVKYVTEYKFDEKRKFRFDIAVLDKKIAIEYEGIFSKKSRHTGVVGYTKDATKYNLAIINGWRVLRYTAMNNKNFIEDLKMIL